MVRLKYVLYIVLIVVSPGFRSLPSEIILPTEQKIIHDLCFSKNGAALLVADGTNIRWFSVDSHKVIGLSANAHKRQLLTINLSTDSLLLASGGKDSTIVLWNVRENKVITRLDYHKGIITSLQISADNRYLISGGTDHKLVIYNLQEQKIEHVFSDHQDDVTSVAFSPSGQIICSGGADGTINFYDMDTFKLIGSVQDLGFIREIAFSQDGSRMISCGDRSVVLSWQINPQSEIAQPFVSKTRDGWLLTSKIYDDSKSIATGSVLGIIKITTPIGTYESKFGVAISDVEFKPDNKSFLTVAIATLGKGVYITEAKNMKFKR